MRLIFLDIDGVLNSDEYDRRNQTDRIRIDETKIPLIRRLVDGTNAQIILSSSWRIHWDQDEEKCDETGKHINFLFNKYGLKIFDKTPYLRTNRKTEIEEYLKGKVGVEGFVIIDDTGLGWEEYGERLVRTFQARGLMESHIEKSIQLLTKH